jgi:hypothetical protein
LLGDLQLAYLGVEVPDVAALAGFLTDVVGLVSGDDPATWRNDDKAQRIIVTEGPAADATFVGFEAAGSEEWAATVARVEQAGYPVEHATPRGQGRGGSTGWRPSSPLAVFGSRWRSASPMPRRRSPRRWSPAGS